LLPDLLLFHNNKDLSPVENECVALKADDEKSLKLSALVRRIQDGDDHAIEDLYGLMRTGVRFVLMRMLPPQEVEDRLHDTFLIVLTAIQRGQLQDPSKVLSYTWSVARRQGFVYIGDVVKARETSRPFDEAIIDQIDRTSSPDALVKQREKAEVFASAFKLLRSCEREILRRFYIDEQSEAQICTEMGLSRTQFRLHKSRAKAKLVTAAQRLIAPQRMPPGKAESVRTVRTADAGGVTQMAMTAGAR